MPARTRPQTRRAANGKRGPDLLKTVPPLDTGSALPLWTQLAERLTAAIHPRRAALAGKLLPTEHQIMERFAVSRPTVRQAMAHLVSAGLITRGRGRGSFVRAERHSHDIALAFEEEALAAKKTLRFDVLERKTILADDRMCRALELPPDTKVERIERLRYVDGVLFAWERRILPAADARRISAAMLKKMAIISLMGAIGRPAFRLQNEVSGVAADAALARRFEISPGTAMLQSEHVYYGAQARALVYGLVCFRWDAVAFSMDTQIHQDNRDARQGGAKSNNVLTLGRRAAHRF